MLGGRAAPAERRLPRERPEATEIGRNPSPSGHLEAESVSLGQPRGSCPVGMPREHAREKKQPEPVALDQSRGRKCPPRAFAQQPPCRPVMGARKGDGNRAESVALGMPRGRIRLPRGVPRQLSCRDAVKAREGDGNRAKIVAPGAPRGWGRHPWAAARQLACRDVTEACKGDGNQPESVTLGMPRGKIRLPRRLPRQSPSPAFRYYVAHED